MDSCTVAILEQFLETLAERIGPQPYKVWFSNLAQLQLTDSTVHITVPNNFVGNWIKKHYASLLVRTANEVVGHDCKLDISVSEKPAKSLPSSPTSKQRTSPTANKKKTSAKKSKVRQVSPCRFSLDDFVVGPSNQLAFATAQNVVGDGRAMFSPLFIHGSCGLGKTHLLQGICNAIRTSRPEARCVYISGEDFTNQFIISLKNNRVGDFRQRFRQVDVLAIDDIHFLANKRATQEEFLHTFNSIETQGKHIILASDTHPKLLGSVIDSLVSRFLAGMVVKIESPDYQTRLAIIMKRQQCLGLESDQAVLEYVARHVRGNVRELEGAMLKLKAYSGLTRQKISLSLAAHVLADHVAASSAPAGIDTLQQVVATHFGLCPVDLQSPRRNKLLALARSLAMYMARKHTGMSYPEIGRAFGRRSHASVISACKKLERLLEEKKLIQWTTAGGHTRCQRIAELVSDLSEQITRKA